jgi:hypothetical protein
MSSDNMIAILETGNSKDTKEYRVAYVTYGQLEEEDRIYEAFRKSKVYNLKADAYMRADYMADSEGWENLEYGIRKIRIPTEFEKLTRS